MQYPEYRFLYPPRPEVSAPKEHLGAWERRGWLAQKKKNGTCTLVFARGDRVVFKTRHNEDHKLWAPQPDHVRFFRGSAGWNVYVAELLHSKVAGGPRHQLYVFDQLVSEGTALYGTTFASRQERLRREMGGAEEDDQYRVAPRVALAKCFRAGFAALFRDLKREDEGLVLKDPGATLKPCLKPASNASWQAKVRIAAANYSF